MNSAAPTHLGLERIIRAGEFLIRVSRGLRTAFAIEQKPYVPQRSALN
jgi:hypothetical protein